MTLYENVKRVARLRGTNISELERTLRWTRGSIAKWDANRPSIDKVMALAKELDVTAEELYG